MFNSQEFSLNPHLTLYTILDPEIGYAHLVSRLETGNQNGEKLVTKNGRERKKQTNTPKGIVPRIIQNNMGHLMVFTSRSGQCDVQKTRSGLVYPKPTRHQSSLGSQTIFIWTRGKSRKRQRKKNKHPQLEALTVK